MADHGLSARKGRKVLYIGKTAERELWNGGKVELWDFSACNRNEEARIEAVSTGGVA